MTTDNDIKSVLGGMLDSFTNDNIVLADYFKDNPAMIQVLEALKKNDPELFYFNLAYPMSNVVDGLLNQHYKNHKLIFLFKHYDFIDSHLCHLFSNIEGGACSADKARAVIRSLVNYFLTNKEIVWNYDQEYTYHLPTKILKNHEQIIMYFDSLHSLYYGNHDKYLKYLIQMTTELKNN